MNNINMIKDMLEVQGQDGNWNYNSYMLGLYNGLELALATLENRNPKFKESPQYLLSDIINCSNKPLI